MKCFKCGAEIPAGSKFCKKCGEAADSTYQKPVPQIQNPYLGTKPQNQEPYPDMRQYPASQGMYAEMQRGSAGPCTASLVLGIVADVSVVIGLMIGGMAANRDSQLWGLVGAVDPSETEMAVAGLFMFAGIICSIIGFIMAVYGLAKKRRGKGRAVGGLVCSLIILVPVVLMILSFA